MKANILPTGDCFCGCGDPASRGAYFIAGHDRKVDKWLNEMLHGNTVDSWTTVTAHRVRASTTPTRNGGRSASRRLDARGCVVVC